MSSSRPLCCVPSVNKQNMMSRFALFTEQDIEKIVEDKDLQNIKRSTKVAKELFTDYVKEKKLREPEQKKQLAQTLKTFNVKARKKEFVQCIIKQYYYYIQFL